jgi:hypothetical protein
MTLGADSSPRLPPSRSGMDSIEGGRNGRASSQAAQPYCPSEIRKLDIAPAQGLNLANTSICSPVL